MTPLCLRLIVFFAVGLILAGCSVRDAKYAPRQLHFTGKMSPPEVHPPMTGIYHIDAASEQTGLCCWIGPHTSFFLKKPFEGHRVTIGLYVPDFPVFERSTQTVTVWFGDKRTPLGTRGLKPGFHTEHFALRDQFVRAGSMLKIGIDSSVMFHPTGAVGPEYSVVLISAYFE